LLPPPIVALSAMDAPTAAFAGCGAGLIDGLFAAVVPNFATKASSPLPPPLAVWYAPAVVGKFVEAVSPVI